MRTHRGLVLAVVTLVVVCSTKVDAHAFFDEEYAVQVSSWTAWSEPFGFGQIGRHRKILRHPTTNGLQGPILEEIQYTGVRPTLNQTAAKVERDFIKPKAEDNSAQEGYLRDLLIIMDSSGSVASSEFTKAKTQLGRLLELLCPLNNPFERGFQHAAMLVYSSSVREVFDFNDHASTTAVKNAINQAAYTGGGTCTNLAFQRVRDMYTVAKGARFENNVKWEVLIISDGQSNCGDAIAAAEEIHDIAEVFGLMIGSFSQDGMDELTQYVSTPASRHLFNIQNFNQLEDLVNLIEQEKQNRGQNWCAHFDK